MLVNTTLYTSRSAMETYEKCKALYNYQYVYGGIGMVPATPSRPLEMGTALHLALARLQNGEIDSIVLYNVICEHLRDKFLKAYSTDGEIWTLEKDILLIYALVRVFQLFYLPKMGNEKTVFVEKDVSIPLTNDVILESKMDWITKNNQGLYTAYNYKTSKYSTKEDGRIDKSFEHDLQGILESVVLERALEISSNLVDNAIALLGDTIVSDRVSKILANLKPLSVTLQSIKINSVQYIFFIKGDERKVYEADDTWNGRIINYSPLTYGYHFQSGVKTLYAWTIETINENNKSGKGRLGKGWEAFNVWEEGSLGATPKERVDNWITLLSLGEIQPEMGNPFDKIIEFPGEKFKYEKDIELTMGEVTQLVQEMHWRESPDYGARVGEMVKWPRNRKACTYPTPCPYREVCFRGGNLDLLKKAGEFKNREPHHQLELKLWNEKVNMRKEVEDGEEIRS